MNIRKVVTSTLSIAALAITLAASTAHALPCGITTPCPTNFAVAPALKAPVRMIASGGGSVWALDTNYSIYHFNALTRVFDQVPGSLVWLVAGGGTGQTITDEVWGYNANGQFYRSSNGGWEYIPTPSTGLFGLVVSKGYTDSCHPYEVWGLTTITKLAPNNVRRFNYCTSAWDTVAGQLTTISVGGGEVWGLNAAGQIWRFNLAAGSGWTQIPGTLSSLAVGADGVFGVNSAQQAFQFNPAGQKFIQIANATLTYIEAGGNGVWGQDASNNVWRYQAITRSFVICHSVLLRFLSVGSGGGVWGIDTGGTPRVFVTPAIPVGTVLK